MKRKEWQKYHGFSDETMEELDDIIKLFNGRITEVKDNGRKENNTGRIANT